MFVLVGGWPAAGKTTLARELAAALELPLLSKDEVKEALLADTGAQVDLETSRRLGRAAVVALLTTARGLRGAVIDSTWYDYARPLVHALPGPTVELRCHVPREVARSRYADRARHPGHLDSWRDEDELWGRPVAPLGVGPLVEIDTSGPVDVAAVAARIVAAGAVGGRGHDQGMSDEAAAGVARPDVESALEVLETAYGLVLGVVDALADEDFGRPTRAEGWTVMDLLVHMLLDPQRALVTFATPGVGEPDVDRVTYWHDYDPRAVGWSAAHAEFVRRMAAAYAEPRWLVGQLRETLPAVINAGRACPHARVATQGHVLDLRDFVETLILEVTVHYLDLTVDLDAPPVDPGGLASTRAVLDSLLGEPVPREWSELTWVLKGTGREALTTQEREQLGPLAARIPLLG